MTSFPSKRFLAGTGVVLALAGALGAYLQARQTRDLGDPERARHDGRPIPVRTASVGEEEVEQVIGATALTIPSQMAQIRVGASNGLKLTDVVTKAVHVHEGDRVRPGQVLFELEPERYLAVLKEQQAQLAYAEVELDRVKKQVSFNQALRALEMLSAKAELAYRIVDVGVRATEYRALKGLPGVKLFEVYDAESAWYAAKYYKEEAERRIKRDEISEQVGALRDREELAKAVADLEKARAELAIAQRDVERCQIRSPLDGFMTRVDLVPGQVLTLDQVLTTVDKLDPIFVQVDFPQERIDEVSVGQKVEVVLDSYPKETFHGHVLRISPQANPQLRVLPVVVELANPHQRIKAGISGYARLFVAKKATVVPATAVIEQGGKAMAFRVEAGRARLREVRTGHLLRTGVLEVLDGLAAGDQVVLFHNFYRHADTLTKGEGFLQDNDPVDVDWRKWAGRE